MLQKISLLFLLLFSIRTISQEKIIKGKVSDASGPLPGVTIQIKGTKTGTSSDYDGKYTIKAKVGDVLEYSYLGYKSVRKRIKKSSSIINVTLKESENNIEEVVITAQGIKQTQRVLGYSMMNKKKLKNRRSNITINQVLQGNVSGVTINGATGVTSSIKIRGMGALKESGNPLYVINGVPQNVNPNIPSNQIKSINIVKDSTATSLYGSRGVNGVIVITTKSNNAQIETQEDYEEIEENKFERTSLAPLSTFSIDVDKASYSNIRRMINNGQKIPSNAVKIEELINYFDYEYPQPKDEHPFSINTEFVKTPWNNQTRLVKIGLQGKTYNQDDLPASNLTFLIDVSGSMSSQNKLPLLKSAFKLLVNQLREQDKVSIVVYAGAAGVVLEPTSGNYKEKIIAALDNLEAGGSTAGGEGIKLAYKLAQENFKKNGNNRVILATDGDFNVGALSNEDMEKLIEEKRKSGVFLSVLGFGYGNYKDSKLEILADKGNGNHAYIDTMQEAQKVFGKEFGGTLYTIAKDVKIQIEFNPNKVEAYSLIGYKNRLLNDEDFIDDTKDAGELGAGHKVTALYEIILKGEESEFLKEVPELKYSKNTASSESNELFTVKFRYKKPSKDKSIEMVHVHQNQETSPSEDLNFASAVALFGMKLRKSKYCKKIRKKTIIALAENGRGEDKNGYRAEFIRLVKSI